MNIYLYQELYTSIQRNAMPRSSSIGSNETTGRPEENLRHLNNVSSTENVRGETILVFGDDLCQRCVDSVTYLLSKIINEPT